MASNEGQEEIHVLMVTLTPQGHLNPMLRLAKRLVDEGLHVTLATTQFGCHRILKAATTTTTTTTDATNFISGIRLLCFPDGFNLDYDRGANLDHYMESLAKAGPLNLSNLIKQHYHHTKLSCIICNPFVSWAVDAALENGIPCAMLWIQPCSLYSIYYRFYKLNQFPTTLISNMIIELPGLPSLHTDDLPSFLLPSNSFGGVSKLLSDMFQTIKKYKWVLANSFFELEKEAIESMTELCPIRPVGPLVPPSLLDQHQSLDVGIEMKKPDETSLDWLNKQRPHSVIYVSFGSLAVLSDKTMEAIATALKNTKHPFLWVVKTAGQLPLGFEEETETQGLIIPWSLQTKVLAHPSIACFITHCGWNSMLEALVAGVPMIAYPQWSDQPTNGKLIVDVFKVGLKLKPGPNGVISNEDIEECINQMLSGREFEGFKKNAAVLKQAAREAVTSGGSSERNIQLFVNEIARRS